MDLGRKLEQLEGRIRVLELGRQFKGGKEVQQLDAKTGELIATFTTIQDAYRATKVRNISAACTGVLDHAGGFSWRFTGVVTGNQHGGRKLQHPEDVQNLIDFLEKQPGHLCTMHDIKQVVDGNENRAYHVAARAVTQGKLLKIKKGRMSLFRLAPSATPEPPTEKPDSVAGEVMPIIYPRYRKSPEHFPRLTKELCFQVLDLSAEGLNNDEICERTGRMVSAGMACRLRVKGASVKKYWSWIEDWKGKNPGRDLRPAYYAQPCRRHK